MIMMTKWYPGTNGLNLLRFLTVEGKPQKKPQTGNYVAYTCINTIILYIREYSTLLKFKFLVNWKVLPFSGVFSTQNHIIKETLLLLHLFCHFTQWWPCTATEARDHRRPQTEMVLDDYDGHMVFRNNCGLTFVL